MGVIVLMASLSTTTYAQSGIAGVVKDPSGGVLPGVTVEAKSPALIEQVRSAVTDDGGQYKIVDLRPGTYAVTFTLPGFSTLVRDGIQLPDAFMATVNVAMTVGGLEESLTVTGEAPLVDTQGTQQQTTFDRATLDALPTGRNLFAEASVVPGITTNLPDVGGSQGMQQIYLQVHGSDSRDLNFQLDGMGINSNNNDGGTMGMYSNEEAIQELSLKTSALPAEIAGGGVNFSIIPKVGGNTLHGSALAGYSNHGMESSNLKPSYKALGLRAPDAVNRIYDGNIALGGPIVRDRAWFFVAFRRWSTDSLVADTFNLDGSQAIDDNRLFSGLGRLTMAVGKNSKFTGYYENQGKYRGHRRPAITQFVEPEATWVQRTPNGYTAQGKWTSVINSRLYFEGGYSIYFLHWSQEYRPESVGQIARVDTVTSVLSGATQYLFNQWNQRNSYVASVQYVTGAHALKAGMQLSNGPFRQTYLINGDMIERFANGVPSQVQAFNTPLDYSARMKFDGGFYVQDSWTFKKVTINAGLRWDHLLWGIDAGSNPAGTFVGARQWAAVSGVPDFSNFSPRFGMTWDPFGDGKTAIKASVSRYNKSEGASLATTNSPAVLLNSIRTWTDSNRDRVAQLNEIGASTGFTGANTTVDPNLTRAFNWEETVSVQRELAAGLSANVTYYHRNYRNLWGTANTLTPPSAYSPFVIANPLDGQPFTVYNLSPALLGQVSTLLTNHPELNRTYNGVEINVTKRFRNGANVMSGMTIGKTEGMNRGTNKTDNLNDPNVLINAAGAYGFDSPYSLKVAGSYPLPAGLQLSGVLQANSGLPLRRILNLTKALDPGLTQVSETIDLVPSGTYRLPFMNLLDLRIAKKFNLGSRGTLTPQADVFNTLNSGVSISEVQVVGPSLGKPSGTLPGRLLKFSVNWTF